MRWIWIDKFTEFTSRTSATAVKNVSLAEEHLHDLYPAFPIVPHSLIVEGMAQTAGILVGEARNFSAGRIAGSYAAAQPVPRPMSRRSTSQAAMPSRAPTASIARRGCVRPSTRPPSVPRRSRTVRTPRSGLPPPRRRARRSCSTPSAPAPAAPRGHRRFTRVKRPA